MTQHWPRSLFPLLPGLLGLGIVALRASPWTLPPLLVQLTSIHVQALLFILSAALVVAGLSGLTRQDAGLLRAWVAAHRHEILLVGAIMGLAGALRLVHLGAVQALIDEGPYMAAVNDLRENFGLPLTAIMDPVVTSSRVFPWLQMLFSELFGSSLAVFRLPAVLFGTLTVGATYALARTLYDRRTAYLAALLLATFPPHLHMSRISVFNIADPLFGLLALAFFVRALQSQRRLDYVLSGAMLGLLPYFYEAGELLFPALLICWIIWLRLRGGPNPSRRGLSRLLLSGLLMAAPLYLHLASNQRTLFSRLDYSQLNNSIWLDLLTAPDGLAQLVTFVQESLAPRLLHYVITPDPSLFYGGPTALVLPPLVPLLLAGITFALRRGFGGLLMLLWLLLTVLGNSLLNHAYWTPRFIVAMPALAILMALGLRDGLPLLLRRPGWRLHKLLVVGCCLLQIAYYYGIHLPAYQGLIVDLRQYYDVILRTATLPEDFALIFLYRDPDDAIFMQDTVEYLGHSDRFTAMRLDQFDPATFDREGHYIIMVDPYDQQALDRMAAVWHLDGPHFDSPDPTLLQQYASYRVSPLMWRDGG